MMTLEEFDRECAGPDPDELDRKQEELMRLLEFMVEMEVMWHGKPKA